MTISKKNTEINIEKSILYSIIGVLLTITGWLIVKYDNAKTERLTNLEQTTKETLVIVSQIKDSLNGYGERNRGIQTRVFAIEETDHKQWQIINRLCLKVPSACISYNSSKKNNLKSNVD